MKTTRMLVAGAALALTLTACSAADLDAQEPAASAVAETTEAEPVAEETSPEPEPEPEPEPADEGTRENPFPAGTVVGNDDFTVQVGQVTWDATDAVRLENQFNEPPGDGNTYVLVPLTVTNVASPDAVTPWLDVDIAFVADDGRSFESASVVTPSDLNDVADLYTGGVGTGNVAFVIPVDAQAGGTWAISPTFGDPVFVAAH